MHTKFTGVGKRFEIFNKNKRNYAKPHKKAIKCWQKRHFCLKVFCKKALLFNEKALLFKKSLLKICINLLKRIKNKNALVGRAFCLKA